MENCFWSFSVYIGVWLSGWNNSCNFASFGPWVVSDGFKCLIVCKLSFIHLLLHFFFVFLCLIDHWWRSFHLGPYNWYQSTNRCQSSVFIQFSASQSCSSRSRSLEACFCSSFIDPITVCIMWNKDLLGFQLLSWNLIVFGLIFINRKHILNWFLLRSKLFGSCIWGFKCVEIKIGSKIFVFH